MTRIESALLTAAMLGVGCHGEPCLSPECVCRRTAALGRRALVPLLAASGADDLDDGLDRVNAGERDAD